MFKDSKCPGGQEELDKWSLHPRSAQAGTEACKWRAGIFWDDEETLHLMVQSPSRAMV